MNKLQILDFISFLQNIPTSLELGLYINYNVTLTFDDCSAMQRILRPKSLWVLSFQYQSHKNYKCHFDKCPFLQQE